MNFDLASLATILVATTSLACGCPGEPELEPGDGAVPLGAMGIAEGLADTQCAEACGGTCTSVEGTILSDAVRCVPIEGEPFEIDALSGEEVSAALARDCMSVCSGAPGYDAYLDAGFRPSEIESSCSISGDPLGEHTVSCSFSSNCAAGRRPPAWQAPHVAAPDELGAYWATMAVLEHAAVIAFDELAGELAHHDAPAELVARVHEAADDERRHARICHALARASGACPTPAPAPRVRPPRSLAAIALHNATEGCVLEAFAAVRTAWQSRHASDPIARRVLARIAADELRHGQLAWDLEAWLVALAGAELRERTLRARRAALASLVREHGQIPFSLACVGLHRGGLEPLVRGFARAIARADAPALPSRRPPFAGSATARPHAAPS